MVDFVHEGTSEEAIGFDAYWGAIFKLSFDFDFFGAGN